MKDLFEALSDFLSSDFAKENSAVIVILTITVVVLSVSATVIVFNKLVIPLRLNRLERIAEDYKKVSEENERLKNEMTDRKNMKKMLDAVNSENSDTEELEGWERAFLTRKEN